MHVIYRDSCPACHGPIDSLRLSQGLPCRSCLPNLPKELLAYDENAIEYKRKILSDLLRNPGDYLIMRYRDEELEDFERFFEKIFGRSLWPIQRSWVRRLLDRESFALVAPTGVGKSTLLQLYSLYMAGFGKKIYFITPTRDLSLQTFDRLEKFSRRAGSNSPIYLYTSSTEDLLQDYLDLISKVGGVLITTSAFLSRRFNDVNRIKFDIVIADDLDAILRSSRNAERILELLGYSREIIDYAYKINRLKEDLLFYKFSGRKDLYEKIREEIEVLRANISSYNVSNDVGQLIVATATGRSGMKTRVLQEVLGLEVGGILDYVREIIDAYKEIRDEEDLESILRTLGRGTIIYVSKIFRKKAEDLYKDLRDKGFKIGLAMSGSRDMKRFLEGDLDYIIATASFYGVAVRGIDAPKIVRNTVFLEPPAHIISLDSFLRDPRKLALVLLELSNKSSEAATAYRDLMKIVSKMRSSEIWILRKMLSGEYEVNDSKRELYEKMIEYIDLCMNLMRNSSLDKIVTRIGIIKIPERRVLIPDIMTYIQASGRSSRIYNNTFTLGFSLVLYEDRDLLDLFLRKMKKLYNDFDLRSFDSIDLDRIKKLQDHTRSDLPHREDTLSEAITIKRVLMIVESPTKAKTIARLFGSSSRRSHKGVTVREFSIKVGNNIYVVDVIASLGHVTDLVSDEGLYGVLYEGGFTPVYGFITRCLSCGYQTADKVSRCPRCGSSKMRSQEIIVEILRKLAQSVDLIYIATDPDAEGEKIAFDISNLISPYNPRIYRIEFHEISRKAILKAFENPRRIDPRIVSSQIVRRIDDRWIGFIASGFLQKKYNMKWLGVGRVQTPVLKWIIDSYSNYKNNLGYWIYIDTSYRSSIGLLRIFVKDRSEAETILKSDSLTVDSVEKIRRVLSPPPPFTTDEMLSSADSVLGFTPEKTMRLAQDLFELGLITYHRTDSTHVSANGIEVAREYVSRVYGKEFFNPRSWGEEKAHEAIRPVYPMNIEEIRESSLAGDLHSLGISESHEKLYELIFRRFIASQMIEADVEYCKIYIDVGGYKTYAEGLCKVYREGFLRVYNPYKIIPEELQKPGSSIEASNKWVKRGSPTPLLRGGDIIRMMKERNIGRPSTYTKAIGNNLRHGYVIESRIRRYLIPTKLGMKVAEVLQKIHPELLSEKATRDLEVMLDRVAEGGINVDEILRDILRDLSVRYPSEMLKLLEIENIPVKGLIGELLGSGEN
ncbi:MAG: reverse gyrase [Sulfolobales archaeon]